MLYPLDSPAQGKLELQTRIFGSPRLLLDGQPLPARGKHYDIPLPGGGTAHAVLRYGQDPFIPAVEIDGNAHEVVTRSPLALGLSILPLVLGAALGANLGNRMGSFAVLVLGVLCGSIAGYFFQKAVYFVLRSSNPAFARVLITVGLYFALLMLMVFATAVLAVLFPERMAE